MKKALLILTLFITSVGTLRAQQPGTVKYYSKISGADTSLGQQPDLKKVGFGLCLLYDIDGDGVNEIAAGCEGGYGDYITIMKMDSDAKVKSYTTIHADSLGIPGSGINLFGRAITDIGDLNGDGIHDLAVGNPDSRGDGEVVILFLNAAGTVDSFKEIYPSHSGFWYSLNGPNFGQSVANIGDLDGDGVNDLAVGNGGAGAVWILFMKSDGTVKSAHEIANGTGDLPNISPYYRLGLGIASLGDLDKDGHPDIIVSSVGDSALRGDAWTLFLNSDGTVKNYYHYVPGTSTFPDTLNINSEFGYYMANIGDIDGDSVTDIALAAGDYRDSLGQTDGRIWILFLNTDGSIKAEQIIDRYHGNFTAHLKNDDAFGVSVASIGDFNRDGIYDIAVGAPGDDDANPSNPNRNSGAVYLLYLNGVPIITGVGDVIENKTKGFYAYPNPASDHLVIRSRDANKWIHYYSIIDITGHILNTQQINKSTVTINVQDLAAGTYIINVSDGSKAESIHFIKH